MSKQKTLKIISFLWLSSLCGALFAFLTQIIIARAFGPEGFGVYSAAIGTVTLVSPLVGFGLAALWLKIFGQEGWNGVRWLPSSFLFILVSTLIVIVGLSLWAYYGPHIEEFKKILLILSFYLFSQAVVEMVSAKYQLEERYLSLSIWQFLPNGLRFLIACYVGFYYSEWEGIYKLVYGYAILAIFILLFGAYILWRMCSGHLRLVGHGDRPDHIDFENRPALTEVFLNAWPFGAAGIFYLVYYQSDIIILKYLSGDAAAGYYGVAFTILTAIYLLPGVIYQKFLLPKIHRWANSDLTTLYYVFWKGNYLMIILGVIFMIGTLVMAPHAIPIIFGDGYREAVKPLMILAFAIPIRFLASSVGSILATNENMKKKVFFMGLTAVINIALNFSLIPRYGVNGAALATIFSDLFLLIAYICLVKKIFFKETRKSISV